MERLSPEGITVFETLTDGVLEQIYSVLEKKPKDEHVLLITDDCGEDLKKCKPNLLNKLISNSRHLGVSLIGIFQKLSQSPTIWRSNTDTFVVFSATSTREIDALWNEIGVNSRAEFHKMFHATTQGPYSFFVASLDKGGRIRYFASFGHELTLEDKRGS